MRGHKTVICEYCNKEFTTIISKTSKYCSTKCKINAQRKSRTCICAVCGKQYVVFEKYNDGKGSHFCSQKCRSNQKIEKICKGCGTIFKVKPSLISQEFCSMECKKSSNIESYKRFCVYCNKEFYVDFPSTYKKYCSKNCMSISKKVKSVCKLCGVSFFHRSSVERKYCSVKCSNNEKKKVDNLVNATLKRIARGDCISKTELLLKNDLLSSGFTPQFISKFGSIDYAHVDKKIAVFVDGVFWHGHEKCHWRSTSFKESIKRTKCKDQWQNNNMPIEGWTVLRYWDDYVRKHTDECVTDILSYL